MTLIPYDEQQLDQLALRLLELAARVRGLANLSREQGIKLELHQAKALEWMDKLDEWLLGAEADSKRAVLKQRGAREGTRRAKDN